jgi:hypothetical protein
MFPFADKHFRDAFEKKRQSMPKDAQKKPVILSVGNGGARNKAPC